MVLIDEFHCFEVEWKRFVIRFPSSNKFNSHYFGFTYYLEFDNCTSTERPTIHFRARNEASGWIDGLFRYYYSTPTIIESEFCDSIRRLLDKRIRNAVNDWLMMRIFCVLNNIKPPCFSIV